jgi:protein-S-isoprenylcysteine O-methyltransferase Ste14
LLSITDPNLSRYWPFLVLAIFGWAAFSLYWEIAARNVASARQTEARSSRAVHVALASIAQFLCFLPLNFVGRFEPALPVLMALGLAVEAGGLFLAICSRRHLGRYWSGEISIKVEHQLIRTGPYRVVRHPIYTGLLAMYIGTAMVSGEWLAVVGVAVALFAYWRKVRLEEVNLDHAFGPAYAEYRRATSALIPGVF